MSKLEIEIPIGKEVDWEASAKQKKIVLKDKQCTYDDVCKELFKNGHYFIDTLGEICKEDLLAYDSNASTSRHQLECILAKNKLANTARYLNSEWDNYLTDLHYIIWMRPRTRSLHVAQATLSSEDSTILFKSKELAKQAIEILGEETVKLALEPLY